MRGFLDEDRHPNAPRDAHESEMLTLVVNLHRTRPLSVQVSNTGEGDVRVWLPKSVIEIEPVALGSTLRIRVPRWLALREGLTTAADDRQGSLL
ncbi:MAG TPA: hypothetical protein VGN80_19180 [Devosiaceae bacterium]|jgi:hypothetical protein|nr:hypothetical protein [Devosiaceae bacterium]